MEPLGMTTIFLMTCVSCLLLSAWKGKSKSEKQPPGPLALPLIGSVLHLNPRNLPQSLEKLSQKYGPVFKIRLGPREIVVLYGYDVVKEALIDQADDFSGRGILPLFEKFFKGTGIVNSSGEAWKQLRRFTLSTLRDFGMGKKGIEQQIQEEAHFLVERLRNTHERPFDPSNYLIHAVSNIICSIIFGNRFDYEDKKFLTLLDLLDENNRIQNSVSTMLYNFFPSVLERLPGAHHRMEKNIDGVNDFISEILKAHQETLDPSCPRDFIDAFVIKMEQEKGNSHSYFNAETLCRTTLDLFLAGTGTTSNTLRYGLLILMKYPEVEEKIHKEIDHVIGRDRSPCMADRSRMPYTDAVVHEIQRFIDFLPLNVPHAVTKDTKFRNYFIPKDTMVLPMLTSVLYDSKEFPNPEKFDPGHFLNANGTFKKSDYFLPFSTGKRVCAGEGLARMEIFIFLTAILQNFTLKPAKDRKDVDISPIITVFANTPKPYEVSFLPR
ncbi:cytochrome P450 2H1-like [Nothoprocta perdicaria]|uniref:cytochrome P450 2H1-like n=1 Tax=Nothoprocta perdicaria TaxID=30464 RepID=UPI000E1B74A5|nr:cytochrome P450 2H1-like [Nothoprocta perdicaria]